MRVGVVTPRHPPAVGGGFTFHVTVLEALERANTRHEFVLLDISGTGSSAITGGRLPWIDVRAMFPTSGSQALSAPLTEFAALRLALDVVWYLDPPAEVLSVPTFVTVLDLAHRQHPFFPEVSTQDWHWEARESHYRYVLPRATRIFSGTPTGKEQIVRSYGVNPANVIVNPFPTPALVNAAGWPADEEVLDKYGLTPGFLFYPAQFWAHKNHANLLLALKSLEADHGLSPHLVLTGSDKGNLAHVREVIRELALQQRVHILGFVPGHEVASLYRQAAALVFPSFFGPDNLPPLEAFSLDCPVLAGAIEGVEDQLGKALASPRNTTVGEGLRSLIAGPRRRTPAAHHAGECGAHFPGYFDPAQPEDMAAAIARVLGDSRFRTALVQHGRVIAARYTPDRYVQTVLRELDAFEPWRRTWPKASLRCPNRVAEFPADLARDGLFPVAIEPDGWLGESSSLYLSAPPGLSLLRVRGEVPQMEDSGFSTLLSINVEGEPVIQSQLNPGTFDVSAEIPMRENCHRIELTFSKSQRLPDPDGRTVGAKLEFIGFDNEVATDSPSDQ